MAHTTDGSEPINFRAALAAFESNSSSSPSTSNSAILRSPNPRPLPAPSTEPAPPQTPDRSSSGNSDPVPRSSSTPRIRKTSENGLLSAPTSNNPFASASSPLTSQPTTSASGMLNAPNTAAAVSPRYTNTPLRKCGSGLSLKELANRSLPRNAGAASPSPLNRSRSRSVAEQQHGQAAGGASSAPGSGRSSPHLGLFADQGWDRTESPVGAAHELDTSADDAMFAHAVMDRSCSASSSLVPPQVPSRKGSVSSTHSASSATPKLPPRPPVGAGGGGASLAPSPTISEFGQFPSTTPKGKSGVAYATYTPGAKRIAGSGGGVGREGGTTPPALPPRSATLGERGRLGAPETPYRARQKSPNNPAPVVPRKPTSAAAPSAVGGGASKPAPPPRPTKPTTTSTWEGGAGGFKFGSSSASSSSTITTNNNNKTSSGNSEKGAPPRHARNPSTGTAAHRKTGSNVFTSISLSDDASTELKRSLESDLHTDHPHSQQPMQRMPPRRPAPASSFRSTNTNLGGQSGVVGVASSLIGTAASALPLFKPNSGGVGVGVSRSLADGAPSKQLGGYAGGVSVSRSASTHSELSIRPGDDLWGSAGRVQLADTPSLLRSKSVLKEPRDEKARERYEALFTQLVSQQRQRLKKRTKKGEQEAEVEAEAEGGRDISNASTIRGGGSSKPEEGSAGCVSALRGWFESDFACIGATGSNSSDTAVLKARTVKRVWSRSRLPASFLAQIYDQASTSKAGLGREEFVKGTASIDAELERRKAKRERRREAKAKRTAAMNFGVGRRVPPPPPAPAAAAV